MEVIEKESLKNKLNGLIFKEKSYFSNRQEINWASLKKCAIVSVILAVIGLLVMPAPDADNGPFNEKVEQGTTQRALAETDGDPTQTALTQMHGGGGPRRVSGSLDYLYASSGGGSSSQIANSDSTANNSMIIARAGADGKTQVPPGTRIRVRLYEKAIVSNQSMPVIGIIVSDFIHEDAVAIPEGSRLFGEMTYDDGGDRAKVDWRSVQFPDGRERPFSAIGVSTDGQVGVTGKVHSDAMKNTAGQTLTRFLGAYAEGSMQKGSFGYNQGGSSNGWKNAVAETAKDRADRWADELKKEKVWIEVSNSTTFFAVLTQSFAFRDPGATYGR